MDLSVLISNVKNPTLLFFLLGIFAAWVNSDLEIPAPSVKFISLYLLFSIGFKGGQELSHSPLPAAMRLAAPEADPGLYIPMALGVTFPFNITVGMPLYFWLVG